MTFPARLAQSEENKALVKRLFDEIFNAGSLDAADEIFAADYVEHAVAPFGTDEPGRVHGPSHARETVEWLRAQFPDLEMTIESIVADDDTIAVRVRSEGTNLGRLGGIAPATNKRFVAEQSHWYRVADGKLREHWATRDDLSAMLQLGVIHPPGLPQTSGQDGGAQISGPHSQQQEAVARRSRWQSSSSGQ